MSQKNSGALEIFNGCGNTLQPILNLWMFFLWVSVNVHVSNEQCIEHANFNSMNDQNTLQNHQNMILYENT